MKNVIAQMADQQILEELLRFCPASTKDIQRTGFSAAINRYRQVFESVPPGEGTKSILDIGARLYTASVYANRLDYSRVVIATKWQSPFTAPELLQTIPNHGRISVDYFDAEHSSFPYQDNQFDVVVCSELIEHLEPVVNFC